MQKSTGTSNSETTTVISPDNNLEDAVKYICEDSDSLRFVTCEDRDTKL